MSAQPRFYLSQDQSSHWYLIPVEHRAEWDAFNALPDDDERSWHEPRWAVLVDGPHRVTFTDPR